MRRFAFLWCAAALVGCAKSEEQPAKEAEESAATPAETRAISLSDVAGQWKMHSTDEAGGNPVESELTATADTSGWTMTLPGRKPVPVRVVAVAGDSIVTEAGPYESVLRKGVQVSSRTVTRLQDGKLVGRLQLRYATKAGDSIAYRLTEGTRAP
ncbi:MAG TPA: hypothetical protein VFU40_09370 [Gemmatimonadales bacterium]|nr:hypothetical protein [Gemmatimonadales bacterium]